MSTVTDATDSCPICLDSYKAEEIKRNDNLSFASVAEIGKDDQTPTQLKCNHVFHASCLKTWIETFLNKTSTPPCPTCRTVLIDTPAITPPASVNQTPANITNSLNVSHILGSFPLPNTTSNSLWFVLNNQGQGPFLNISYIQPISVYDELSVSLDVSLEFNYGNNPQDAPEQQENQ